MSPGQIFLLFLVAVATAAPPEKKCRSVVTDLNKREFQRITLCNKELGFKTGREKSDKSMCTMKCVLAKEGLIGADGQLSKDQFAAYLEDHFPLSLHDRAKDIFFPCIELLEGKTIEQDEFCKVYEPMIKCFTRNFFNLCRGLP